MASFKELREAATPSPWYAEGSVVWIEKVVWVHQIGQAVTPAHAALIVRLVNAADEITALVVAAEGLADASLVSHTPEGFPVVLPEGLEALRATLDALKAKGIE